MTFMRLLAAAPATLAAGTAFADQQGAYYGHPMWGGGWHGWFIGPVIMMLFLVAAIALAVFLVRRTGTGDGRAANDPSQNSSLDILKERFARGEIDKTEFEDRRKVLGD
jgi:putative membrane protein